jgi:outer membrane protein assembly factor BamB
VALDQPTGHTVWRRARSIDFQDLGPDGRPEAEGDMRKAFATCQIATFDSRTLLLSQGSRALYAYDPSNGSELWRVEEQTSYSGCTRPVVGHGLVFVPSGFASGQVLAIRPGKPGETLDAKADPPPSTQLQVVWKAKRNAPKKPSLLLVGDLLFGIEDNGIATCWEAATGRILWSEHLGGHFSASPIGAEGRVYCFSEEGKTIVFAAAREFNKLAENELADGFMASAAVSGKALFLRTRTNLYRIQE